MPDEKDTLPSDAEKGSLKPQSDKKREPSTSPSDKKTDEDPSEQPS